MAKKTKSKKNDNIYKIELVGDISLVEERPDGFQKRTEIDGELVLKMILHAIGLGLRDAEVSKFTPTGKML